MSNLQSINSVNLDDIKNNNFKHQRSMKERNYNPAYNGTIPSTISTNISKPAYTTDRRHPKSAMKPQIREERNAIESNLQTIKYQESVDDNIPSMSKKELRRKWRKGKSGKGISKHIESQIVNLHSQDFYSVGNSIHKTESISGSSNFPLTSNQISSNDGRSLILKKNTKKKLKAKKVDFLNFSDRTLSSKLYSIKRKEIDLCFGKSTSSNKFNTSRTKRNGISGNICKLKPKGKKSKTFNQKGNQITAKSTKNWGRYNDPVSQCSSGSFLKTGDANKYFKTNGKLLQELTLAKFLIILYSRLKNLKGCKVNSYPNFQTKK